MTKRTGFSSGSLTKNLLFLRKKTVGGGIFVRLTRRRISFSIFAALALIVLVANLVGYGRANPYTFKGEVPPDPQTYPPIITIVSPKNNTAYNTSLVPMTFNVIAPYSTTASSTTVIGVTYETDWQKEAISVLHESQEQPSFNLQLSNIPEGQHKILIKAVGYAFYLNEKELSYKEARISSMAVIIFTLDQTAPSVSALPPENTSTTSAIPLHLTINEAHSKIAYSLNGQQNVSVAVNSTLPHLAAGQHNVTYYVWDVAGNVGSSEIVIFSVAENPNAIKEANNSLLLPAAVVTSMIVVTGIGLLLYKRCCRQKNLNKNFLSSKIKSQTSKKNTSEQKVKHNLLNFNILNIYKKQGLLSTRHRQTQ